jgi:hypothetical protein
VAAAVMPAEVSSAAEVVPAKAAAMTEVAAAAVVTARMMAVMAASVVSSMSRFGDERHSQCRHQRHHENECASHCGSCVFF